MVGILDVIKALILEKDQRKIEELTPEELVREIKKGPRQLEASLELVKRSKKKREKR